MCTRLEKEVTAVFLSGEWRVANERGASMEKGEPLLTYHLLPNSRCPLIS
jgi:hypothetical protein